MLVEQGPGGLKGDTMIKDDGSFHERQSTDAEARTVGAVVCDDNEHFAIWI